MDRLQLCSLFSNRARAKQRLNISKGIKIDYYCNAIAAAHQKMGGEGVRKAKTAAGVVSVPPDVGNGNI